MSTTRDVEWTIDTWAGEIDVCVTVNIHAWGSSDSYSEPGDAPEFDIEAVFTKKGDRDLYAYCDKQLDLSLGNGYKEGWSIEHGYYTYVRSPIHGGYIPKIVGPRVTLNEGRTILDKLYADIAFNFYTMFEPDESDYDYSPSIYYPDMRGEYDI